MTVKKSRRTSGSAVTGRVTSSAKVGKMLQARGSGATAAPTKVTGRKVEKGGSTSVGGRARVKVSSAGPERVRVGKMQANRRPVKLDAVDRDGARVLDEVMTGASEVTITTAAGKTARLTGALLSVLRNVVAAVERGESVTVLEQDAEVDPVDAVLSSQEAADLLNVSRPFVVKLAKTGQLAHHLVGNRHRFDLADVLAYAEQMRRERSEVLGALAPDGGYASEDF